MLRELPTIDLLRHEMRRRVCVQCQWRPPHSEALGPEAVRPCELTCPVFAHLHRLTSTAVLIDPMLRSRETALRHGIDQICVAPPGHAGTAAGRGPAAGSEPDGTPGDSPLNRYREQVIEAILDIVGRR
jgi:hypothetical protein